VRAYKQMIRRTILVVLATLAVTMNALGCGGAWIASAQARDCCAHEKCAPASRVDSCCKAAPAGSTQDLETQARVSVAIPAVAALSVCEDFIVSLPIFRTLSAVTDAHAPPGDPSDLGLQLRI
jgi:hypothetical protein